MKSKRLEGEEMMKVQTDVRCRPKPLALKRDAVAQVSVGAYRAAAHASHQDTRGRVDPSPSAPTLHHHLNLKSYNNISTNLPLTLNPTHETINCKLQTVNRKA